MKTHKDKILEDTFLQDLMQAQGLDQPSSSFTQMVMQQLSTSQQPIVSSRQLTKVKYMVIAAFVLFAAANFLLFFYMMWPYVSLWVPTYQTMIQGLSTLSTVLGRILQSYSADSVKLVAFGITILIGISSLHNVGSLKVESEKFES